MQLILAVLLLAPGAQAFKSALDSEFGASVEGLRDAVAQHASPAELHRTAWRIADTMPRTNISVAVDIRNPEGVDSIIADRRTTVEDMIDAAQQASARSRVRPPAEIENLINAALTEGREMNARGRFSFAALPDFLMGLFTRPAGAREGRVMLAAEAEWFHPVLGMIPFVHEHVHSVMCRAGQLHEDDVIGGEMPAHMAEAWMLVMLDPSGKLFGGLHRRAQAMKDANPGNHMWGVAESYLRRLAVLRATGGVESKVREVVEKVYAQGAPHGHHSS